MEYTSKWRNDNWLVPSLLYKLKEDKRVLQDGKRGAWQLTDAEYNRRKIEIEDEQPSSDDNHDSALVESTKVPSSGGENIILNKKTLFGIDDSRDFIEIPPTPLSEFMQTTFGITDENTAIDKLNQIQSQAYGDLNSDEGEDGEWVVSGKMYNLQKREVCEDAFWDMIDIVEDIRSTGVARDITTQQTVQQLSSELGVPESMFRHVFRVLAFDMCGGSSDDMPHCNKEGYFVFPKPIMNLKRR